MVKKFNLQHYIHHLKNPNKQKLQQQIKEEITDSDLTCYFGKRDFKNIIKYSDFVVGEVMKERRRRERERLINLSTCGCVIQLYLWENTQFIEIREFGWGFLMLTS